MARRILFSFLALASTAFIGVRVGEALHPGPRKETLQTEFAKWLRASRPRGLWHPAFQNAGLV